MWFFKVVLAYFGVLTWYQTRISYFQTLSTLRKLGFPGFCPGILPGGFRESHGSQMHWSVLQTLIKQWPTYIFPNSSKPSSSQNFWVMPWSCTPFGPAATAGCCQIHIFYCNLTADTMYALIRFVLYDNGVKWRIWK